MCIQSRANRPAGVARFAMIFLILGIAWPYFFHPATGSWKGLSDGLRGIMFGLSIGINLMAARSTGRQPGCGGN